VTFDLVGIKDIFPFNEILFRKSVFTLISKGVVLTLGLKGFVFEPHANTAPFALTLTGALALIAKLPPSAIHFK
jgi:hypothetical protein